MFCDNHSALPNIFCEQCGITSGDYMHSEDSICTLDCLICSKCGLDIDLHNNANMVLLEGCNIVDIQLMILKIEDDKRLQQQIRKFSMNLKTRNNMRKHKKQKLYKDVKNSFTFGGVYYKRNIKTGDYFLSEFSYGTKKKYQKESNSKIRNSINFGSKGSNYKKLYDIKWKII